MAAHRSAPTQLTIEVDPELHRRLKRAAAAHHMPLEDYAALVLARVPDPGSPAAPARNYRDSLVTLTEEERRRGRQALAELERFRAQLADRWGTMTTESWELLNGSRDQRLRDLTRNSEE